MDFPEAVKLEAKRRAHYQCVICRRSVFLHVHHITPQEEGGPGDLDNAAPLCVECHDLHGGDPGKQKWIREARDFWWEHCAAQAANPATLPLLERFDQLQTDVAEGRREIAEVKTAMVKQLQWVIGAVKSAQSVGEIVQASSGSATTQLDALRRIWPKE